jgi:predicted nuclease of predicted toxin-antitoxin system
MKFLCDQDVYASTGRCLSGLGHDVVTATQLKLGRAADAELLRVAHEQSRILVTRDRDYGGLVFVQGGPAGVIYLRMLPATENAVHAELERVLTTNTEQELQTSFVVVEPGRHRLRKLTPRQKPSE